MTTSTAVVTTIHDTVDAFQKQFGPFRRIIVAERDYYLLKISVDVEKMPDGFGAILDLGFDEFGGASFMISLPNIIVQKVYVKDFNGDPMLSMKDFEFIFPILIKKGWSMGVRAMVDDHQPPIPVKVQLFAQPSDLKQIVTSM